MILVTGPSGSGKSSTLAAMISHLNNTATRNIITIEDPIEFVFRNKKCLIRQRDMGDDTKSFSRAVIHALRHDADVIVIGEMRDLDTISTAITAAETGHLVLGTLHTVDAPQSIDRIIDMYPPGQQQQIKMQMSQVLEAVLSQALLPKIEGGRIAAFEIMLANSVIRKLIRNGELFEIHPNMEMGSLEGAKTMDQSLAELVRNKVVDMEEAMLKSSNPSKLKEHLQHKTSRFQQM
jgi:twitching motility protein PilT